MSVSSDEIIEFLYNNGKKYRTGEELKEFALSRYTGRRIYNKKQALRIALYRLEKRKIIKIIYPACFWDKNMRCILY